MVDEFQDTNEIQYQIFLPILDELKSGRLFIVGDEKQSIYKFRDAEIEIFNLTRNDIKKSVGDSNLLVLPDSFRMTPNICAFCNHIFKKLFNEPDEQFGEVPATDLVCARIDDVKGKVELLVARIDEDAISITENELIARKILNIVKEEKYSFKDISILVRKRKHFTDLEKVFLKYEIPFTIIGGRGFYQRQTISDINNYLSFLADKNNNTALVGVLRSPFFNISDSKLYELSLESSRNYWTKLKNIVDDEEIISACNLLKENLSISSSISLPQLIDKIITDKNYLSIIAARNDGEQEIANLAKLISIARNFNATGFRNLYDFLNYLKDSIVNQADEAQAGISSNTDAVQMMTIHQSKGLEFPIVFICKTDESGISSSIKLGEVKIDKKFGVLTKVPLNQNYFEEYQSAPIAALHNYYEEKKNNAELKRLLYVAVTRAKDELYISTTIKYGSAFKKDSFLNLLSSGLQNDFTFAEILIKEKLELLTLENDKYINRTENIQLAIPITTEIDFYEPIIKTKSQTQKNVKLNISSLRSQEKGEIISASKVSIYSQCPLKYLLTYDYGFSKLNSDYKTYNNSSVQKYKNDFVEDEDDLLDDRFESAGNKIQSSDTALYGKIFHKVMEEFVSIEKLDDFINNHLEFDLINSLRSEKIIERLKTD
jgi:ATP-dependent helicase/nuclease subunit A